MCVFVDGRRLRVNVANTRGGGGGGGGYGGSSGGYGGQSGGYGCVFSKSGPIGDWLSGLVPSQWRKLS